jgi:hypothetical protein
MTAIAETAGGVYHFRPVVRLEPTSKNTFSHGLGKP